MRHTGGKWDGEAGLFIPLPDHIVEQYPGGKDGNGGQPHTTFLYVGQIPPEREEEFLDIVRSVLATVRGPVGGNLSQLDYFDQPEEGQRVAFVRVEFNRDIATLREKLYRELVDEGFEVGDRSPRAYFSHTTLAYLDGIDSTYDGDIPSGAWEFDSMEVWNLRKEPIEVSFSDMARAAKLAAKYKSKKETEDGNVVYEYSDRQVQERDKKKAEKVEKLRKSIESVRTKAKKELKLKDDKRRLTALAVLLMDETFERVGNDGSAKEGHYGVTGWLAKHVKFEGGKALISYIGKSGVKQSKEVESPAVVEALKQAVKDKKGDDPVFSFGEDNSRVSATDVNGFLSDFDVTSKDIRGFHANREMVQELEAIRAKGKALPEDKKEKEGLLKKEFAQALKNTAKAVGHEEATLRSNYLIPGLEAEFVDDGVIPEKLCRCATKSEAEAEEDEVQKRTQRKSPKLKPPRKDLRKQRVQEEDPDTDGKDKDMSLRDRKARENPQSFAYKTPHISERTGPGSVPSNREHRQGKRGTDMAASPTEQLDRVATLLQEKHEELGIPKEQAMKLALNLDKVSDAIDANPRVKQAREVSAALDAVANVIQASYEEWDIPPDVAKDAAYKLDLLSDHFEKKAGITAADFDAGTIGEEVSGPVHVEDKSDDMPGDFTQEEFASVREEAESRQTPLPKEASDHGYNLFL